MIFIWSQARELWPNQWKNGQRQHCLLFLNNKMKPLSCFFLCLFDSDLPVSLLSPARNFGWGTLQRPSNFSYPPVMLYIIPSKTAKKNVFYSFSRPGSEIKHLFPYERPKQYTMFMRSRCKDHKVCT